MLLSVVQNGMEVSVKTLSVALATGIGFLLATPAQGSILSVGNSLAQSCFHLAKARQSSPSALETCDRALSEEALNFDDRVATLVNRGIVHNLRSEFVQAGRDFDAAIALDAAEPEAWLNKAVLFVRQGQTAAAMPLIERAIVLKTSKPALAYYMRGLVNEDAGNLNAAYDDLVRARDLDPSWADPVKELQRYRVRRPATGRSS